LSKIDKLLVYSGDKMWIMDTKAIGERLKERRLALGWSPKEAALHAKVTQQYIGQLEKGDLPKPWGTLFRICEVFEVSADWLFGLPNATDSHPVQGRELSKVEEELLAVFQSMPDERARGSALASAKAIGENARDFAAVKLASDSAEAVAGMDELMQLRDLLLILSIRLGSLDNAIEFIAEGNLSELARSNTVNEFN
jgi:transcriptional regulator with XRE-family HTH domain